MEKRRGARHRSWEGDAEKTGTQRAGTSTGRGQVTWQEGVFVELGDSGGPGESGRRKGGPGLAQQQEQQGEKVRWERVLDLRTRIQAGIYEIPLSEVVARWLAAERRATAAEPGM